MRLYEYVCKIHGAFEAFADQDNRHESKPCKHCGEESVYVVSTPRVELEGVSGHFPTAYDKWTAKHEKGAKQFSHWLEGVLLSQIVPQSYDV